MAILFSLLVALGPLQGSFRPDQFGTIAEGLTADHLGQGIKVEYRMFTLPMLPKACKQTGGVAQLVTKSTPVVLTLGKRFALSSLSIVAMDSSGHRLSNVPIFIEVENATPWLLNVDPERIADVKLSALHPGKFNFRARMLCPGPGVEVRFPAVITGP